LVIASAAVVSVFSIITAMQSEISAQLADMGANIIVTADNGELTFQYGGITIPDLVYDAESLTEADLEMIGSVSASTAIVATAPRLISTMVYEGNNLVVAGVHLENEFIVKPWLRFQEDSSQIFVEAPGLNSEDPIPMDYQALNLERITDVPQLTDKQVIAGATVSSLLGLKEGSIIELSDKRYTVIAILEENGLAEDSQLFMNLEEMQRILGKPGELTLIELAADFDRIPEEKILTELKTALPHASISGVKQAVMGRNELLNSLSRFGFFAGALIFITGMVVVMLTMFASVRERTREIGIFRAIGFRGLHIFKIIISETLIVSTIGGAAGYHIGLAAARIIAPTLTGASLNSPWQFTLLISVIIITAITGSLAGLAPALKAARLEPAEALRFI
ncbi:MAG: ABC transporter permease, partial [Firmicutes bacterium]|nr:ABC transporter permease [Bacillota bacterium]